MIPITLVTPLLGDGFSDFERHMLSFNVLMDLSILLLLGHMTALIFGGVINRHGAEKGSRVGISNSLWPKYATRATAYAGCAGSNALEA